MRDKNKYLPNCVQYYRDVIEPARKELEKELNKHTWREKKMKNFEKYEKEIKKLEGRFSLTDEDKLIGCIFSDCEHCQFKVVKPGVSCNTNRVNWLYEEYKDPLLTEYEKEYLADVIRPFRDKATHIFKAAFELHIVFQDGKSILIPLYGKFRGLEQDKYYTLSELGLYELL